MGAADRVATHWLYLNIVSFLSIIFFLFKKSEVDIIKSITSNKPLLILLIFGSWAALSILYSINVNESIISVIRLLTLILTTIMIGLHLSNLNSLKYFFLIIIFPIIVFEILIPTVELIRIISVEKYSFELSNYLKTFTPNKNITAAIITSHIGLFSF